MVTSKLLTAEDVWNMPDDGCRRELIRGELITMSPAARPHGKYLIELGWIIRSYLEDHPIAEIYGGDTGYILARDPDLLLAPDLSVILLENLPENPPETGFEELVPDLVVEILSPSERTGHVLHKVAEYLNAGVKLVWLVDPSEKKIMIYGPDRLMAVVEVDDTLDGGEVLPGFALPLRELFGA